MKPLIDNGVPAWPRTRPKTQMWRPYARVSSDLQSAASIDDQLRICSKWAAKQGWLVAGSYTDQAVSGASLIRPGIQKLLQASSKSSSPKPLTACPATRRTSPNVYKRMLFQGVRIVTLFEGEVNKLHIGLKGTMGALDLKERAIVSVATRPWRAQATYLQLIWALCIDPADRMMYLLI